MIMIMINILCKLNTSRNLHLMFPLCSTPFQIKVTSVVATNYFVAIETESPFFINQYPYGPVTQLLAHTLVSSPHLCYSIYSNLSLTHYPAHLVFHTIIVTCYLFWGQILVVLVRLMWQYQYKMTYLRVIQTLCMKSWFKFVDYE